MRHSNGFIYLDYRWLVNPLDMNNLAWLLLRREEKRNKKYYQARFGFTGPWPKGTTVFDCVTDLPYVEETRTRLKKHLFEKLHPRLTRLMKWVEHQNKKRLAELSPAEAMSIFQAKADELPPLYWWECLPYGISHQDAVNTTGVSIHYSTWASIGYDKHGYVSYDVYPKIRREKE